MAGPCVQCELPFNGDQRRPKVLPCGHSACLACLLDHTRAVGRLCPSCRKIFKADPEGLPGPLDISVAAGSGAPQMWCQDCDVAAVTACFEQHSLCWAGRRQREVAAELSAVRAGWGAALTRLIEDAAREQERLQQQEAACAGLQDVVALKAELDAAKAHPLQHLVRGGARPLQRALAVLRQREASVGARALAVRQREVALQEQEDALRARELALQEELSSHAARARGVTPRERGGVAIQDVDGADMDHNGDVPHVALALAPGKDEAPAAVQSVSARGPPGVQHADDAQGVASLPDEVLSLVLSLVPARSCAAVRDLLSLRLVCRRWSRALLSTAVWRHRSLAVDGGREHRAAVAALRLLPALRSLEMTISSAEHGGRCLRALATSRCQMRSLVLRFPRTPPNGSLVCTILRSRGPVLEELELDFSSGGLELVPVLGALDLPRLRKLTVGPRMHTGDGHTGGVPEPGPLRLRALKPMPVEALVLRQPLHADLARALLWACRDSLRRVDCRGHHLLPELAACPSLRAATVPASRQLMGLRPGSLTGLEELDVHCRGEADLSLAKQFMAAGPAHLTSVARVRLEMDPHSVRHQRADHLGLVRVFGVLEGRGCCDRDVVQCVRLMPALEELCLRGISGADFFQDDTDVRDAARLRAAALYLKTLHVHDCRHSKRWIRRVDLEALNIKLCTSPGCRL